MTTPLFRRAFARRFVSNGCRSGAVQSRVCYGMTEAAMTATDRRWRNSGGHGRLIDVEEAYYVCRNASGCVGEGPWSGLWSGGCWNESSTRGAQRRARGHVELLQLKAHEREAPREGLGGTDGALSWDRGERARARAAHVAARVRRDRTLVCEAPPATAAGNGDGVSSARELECQVLARHRHRPHR